MKNNTNTSQNIGQLFNIGLNSSQKPQLLREIRAKIARQEKFLLFTPNPEIVLASFYDHKLAKALLNADYLILDGVGLVMARTFLSLPKCKSFLKPVVYLGQGLAVGLSVFLGRKWLFKNGEPIKGRRLFENLISLANKKGWPVFFLGGEGNEAQKAVESLKLSYQKLKVEYDKGPLLTSLADPTNDSEAKKEYSAVKKINDFAPKLIFAAFGAPKAELWASRNLPKLNTVGIMSVGGTFNYYAQKASLPPTFLEGDFEWLWRVLHEPHRLIRILKAVVVFPFKVYLYKLQN